MSSAAVPSVVTVALQRRPGLFLPTTTPAVFAGGVKVDDGPLNGTLLLSTSATMPGPGKPELAMTCDGVCGMEWVTPYVMLVFLTIPQSQRFHLCCLT